jgi:hypothetical protein
MCTTRTAVTSAIDGHHARNSGAISVYLIILGGSGCSTDPTLRVRATHFRQCKTLLEF